MSSVDFLKEIVEFTSLSGREEKLAYRVKQEFASLGYDSIIEAGGNVCGVRGKGRPFILYDAHMDVVEAGAGWSADPFRCRERDGYIIARGSCDDKGSLSAMVWGGSQVERAEGTLYVLASVNEEVAEGNGLNNFLEETGIVPDAVVIGEPSSLRVSKGNRGRVGVRLDIGGVAAHASRPAEGVNAVYRASEIIDRIRNLNNNLKRDSVAVTKVETSNSNINIIPEKCSIYCDYRAGAGSTRESIVKMFQEILRKEDSLNEITPFYPPWSMMENSPVVKAAADCCRDQMGDCEIIEWDFCTNGSFTAGEKGIPTVGFGPGVETEAHSAEERISIESVIKAESFFSALPAYLVKELAL